jgi:transposase
MTMLAETIDAVIGIDTHRDSHEVEIADPAGRPIAVLRIGNDSAGFARLLAAIAEMAPGPRVAVCIEGTRGYGIGLARALAVPGCWCSSVSSPAVSSAAAKASPTRSTRTWRCWPRCAWTRASCRCRGPTATGRRCGSCW